MLTKIIMRKIQEKLEKMRKDREKINVEILETEKQEIIQVLSNSTSSDDTTEAVSKLQKINDKLKEAKELDRKIDKYDASNERIKTLPLQKNTEEWISEIFDTDEIYQYAKNNRDEELLKKFRNRTLTPEEYQELKYKLEYPNLHKKELEMEKEEEEEKKNRTKNEKNKDKYEKQESEEQDSIRKNKEDNQLEDRYSIREIEKIRKVTTINDLETIINDYEKYWIDDTQIATKLIKKCFWLIDAHMPMYDENWFLTRISYDNTNDWSINDEWILDFDLSENNEESENKTEIEEKYKETFQRIIAILTKSKIDKNLIVEIITDYNLENIDIIWWDSNFYQTAIWNFLTKIIKKWELDEKTIKRISKWRYRNSVINWFEWIEHPNYRIAKSLLDTQYTKNVNRLIRNLDKFNFTEDEFKDIKSGIADILFAEPEDHRKEMIKKAKSPKELQLFLKNISVQKKKKTKWPKRRRKKEKEEKQGTKNLENQDVNQDIENIGQKEKIETSENIEEKKQWKIREQKEKVEKFKITPKAIYNLYEKIFEYLNTIQDDIKEENLWELYQESLVEDIKKNDDEIAEEIDKLNKEENQANKDRIERLNFVRKFKKDNIKSNSEEKSIIDSISISFQEFKKETVPFEIDDNVLLYILTYWENWRIPDDITIKINWEDLFYTPEIQAIVEKINKLKIQKKEKENEKWKIIEEAMKKFPETDREKNIQSKMDRVENWSDQYIVYSKQLNNIKERKERENFIKENFSEIDVEITQIQKNLMILENNYVKYINITYPKRVYNLIIEYKKQKNK